MEASKKPGKSVTNCWGNLDYSTRSLQKFSVIRGVGGFWEAWDNLQDLNYTKDFKETYGDTEYMVYVGVWCTYLHVPPKLPSFVGKYAIH